MIYDEMYIYMFPFEKIEKNETVIIYGAGNVGQSFYSQIKKTNYCKVICFIDENYMNQQGVFDVPVMSPEYIGKIKFDKIIIAINSEIMLDKIKKDIQKKYDIDIGKIVDGANREFKLHMFAPVVAPERIKDEDIQLAFCLSGGLGDCIIAKKIISAILSKINIKKKVTIYGNYKNKKFIETVFMNTTFVFNYAGYKSYIAASSNYDISIDVGYFLTITYINIHTIRKKSEALSKWFMKFNESINNYGLIDNHGRENSIHFARCRLNKLNAYTSCTYDGCIDIYDSMVDIQLKDEYKNKFESLDLKGKYMTINYGCGIEMHVNGKEPHKIWPRNYYMKLIELIRNSFPEYLIVQVGGNGNWKLRGCDRIFLNVDLELTKYILKNSSLHIDSEGGLVHLATQLGTKCIVMFGPTPMHFFGYDNNINIAAGCCHDCYYLNDDFSICIRGLSKPECMYSIMPEFVISKIKEYFKTVGDWVD